MPEHRVEPRGPGPSPDSRRIGIPLWPFLLLVLVAVVALILRWPHATRVTADFNPATEQNLVLVDRGVAYAPVPDALHHQIAIPADRMRRVGRLDGHDLYQPVTPGGGAGARHPTWYLRSGTDLFVPLERRSP